MGNLIRQLWLFAQHSPLDSVMDNLGRGLRHRSTRMTTQDTVKMLLLFATAFVAVWAIGRLWHALSNRLRQTRGWLFFRLCRAHGLRWRDHWLLWQVAREHQLHDPAMLFIKPELLQTSSVGLIDPAVGARLAELRTQLFAVSESGVASSVGTIPEAGPARQTGGREPEKQPAARAVAPPRNPGPVQPKVPAVDTPPAGTPLLNLTAKSVVDVASWFPESPTGTGTPAGPRA